MPLPPFKTVIHSGLFLACEFLKLVSSLKHLLSVLNRRFDEVLALAKCTHGASTIEFLLVLLESSFDVLAFLDRYN